jgi:hypothetical protein
LGREGHHGHHLQCRWVARGEFWKAVLISHPSLVQTRQVRQDSANTSRAYYCKKEDPVQGCSNVR